MSLVSTILILASILSAQFYTFLFSFITSAAANLVTEISRNRKNEKGTVEDTYSEAKKYTYRCKDEVRGTEQSVYIEISTETKTKY